ncbi:MAG: hypothetical protein M3Q33_03355 [Acidobacteriota bacterium]|nr:hypothetical protein [Acidobacteriota bacterium]
MTLDSYRKWLIGIWSAGFVIPFILILFQFGSGKYGEKFTEVFGWLTALTLPTILLMIGVIIASPATDADKRETAEDKPYKEKTEAEKSAEQASSNKAAHENFIFKLAVGVSVLYLLIVNFVFFLEPFANSKPQELMRDSKIFLAVFDSIISLLIGYFFGKK